jgi:hypothetical protein
MSDDYALRNRLPSEANDDTFGTEEPHYMNFRPSLARRSSESAVMPSSANKKKPMPGPKPSTVTTTIAKLGMQTAPALQPHLPAGSRSKTGPPVTPPPVAVKASMKKSPTFPQPVLSRPPTVSVTAKTDAPPKMDYSKKAVEHQTGQWDSALYCDAIDVQRYRLPPEEARSAVCSNNPLSNDCIYEEAIPVSNIAAVEGDMDLYQEAVPVVPSKMYLDNFPIAAEARNGRQGHTGSAFAADSNENCIYEEAACVCADRLTDYNKCENGGVCVDPEPLYAEPAVVLPRRVLQKDRGVLQNTYEEAAIVQKAYDDGDNSDSEDEPLYFKLMILKQLVNEPLCFISGFVY